MQFLRLPVILNFEYKNLSKMILRPSLKQHFLMENEERYNDRQWQIMNINTGGKGSEKYFRDIILSQN